MRQLTLLAMLGLVGGLTGPAHAISFVINNGLMSPNAANIIDDATYQGDEVFVRRGPDRFHLRVEATLAKRVGASRVPEFLTDLDPSVSSAG